MTPPPDPSDRDARLERFVRQAVRDLPARPAPSRLEDRVLAELARRAALPWWRKSFAHWPVAARAVFLLVCVALAKGILTGSVWVMAGFDAGEWRAAFAAQFAGLENAVVILQALASCVDIITRNIPSLWVYGAVACVAAVYATVFGLGAAAYRAIQASR